MRVVIRFLIPFAIFLLSNFLQFGINQFEFFNENTFNWLNKTGQILLVLSIAWGLIVLIRTGKWRLLKMYDISAEDNLKERKLYTQFNILEKVIVFLVVIIALGTGLMLFEQVRNVGVSLFASAGIAGLILGFAAQKALSTILAGLQIAITQPIRLEDVVIVENEWGWVEEINLTYVVIRIWDKRRLVVPTTYFLEKSFQNWTRTSAEILGTVFIYTDYSMPFEPLRKELTRILKSSDKWKGKVNVMEITDAKEYTVEIRALMDAFTSAKAWDLRVYVREKLIEFIQKEYPQCLPRTRVMIHNDN
ncbi:MAG: mechanosensitive ion channel family protein [Bacteroidota bacterium]